MIVKTDCKFYAGNKPCVPNKTEGKMCDNCSYYDPVNFKILIIKLDATGDVLRTTSILTSLKEKYPSSHITWLTRKNAAEIFNNNIFVDELLIFEDNNFYPRFSVEKFNLLIHPDASPVSAAVASLVKADEKKGYLLDEKGKVIPVNEDAVEWLEMGIFDQNKKRNKKTYQQIIHEISGLEYKKGAIQLFLSKSEQEYKQKFFEKNKLNRFTNIIGLNIGASSRWQYKKWRIEGYVELIEKLSRNKDFGILLYGGPEEKESSLYLKNKFPFLIHTGTDNTLREFFALLDLSDTVVTGDTLALHAATALGKNVVCLFGPTSFNEIEDYDCITKVVPELDCLVCYKTRCDFKITCMGEISSDMVFNAIVKSLKKQ